MALQKNCWFFCSVVEEFLCGEEGIFVSGDLQHQGLAKEARKRISVKLTLMGPITFRAFEVSYFVTAAER